MNNDKLNKLKVFLSWAYPKGSWFEKSELDLVEINTYCETEGWKEVDSLIDSLVREGFLTKDYRFGKYLYQINFSKTTEKDNKIVEKTKSNSRNKKAKSNTIVARDNKKKKQTVEQNTGDTSLQLDKEVNGLEKKKKEIESLVRSINSSENLPTVAQSGGLFGWFDHKVTGNEMNDLASKVQSKLIGQNQAIKKTTQEFGSVYTSIIDTLGLVNVSLAGAVKASNQAHEAGVKAEKNAAKVKTAQDDIKDLVINNDKLVQDHKKVIQVLKTHKEKLDEIEHIADVDKLYSDFYVKSQELEKENNKISEQIITVSSEIETLKTELDDLSDTIRNFDESLSKEMEAQKTETDASFLQVTQNLKDIQSETESKVETLSSDINKVVLNQKKGFDEKLDHLDDTVKKLEESNLEKIHELKNTSDEAFAKIAKKNEENQNESLAQVKSIHSEMENQLNETKEYFQNQLKTTRLLTLISFIAFIVLLILILSGVI
ncbi:hypothetical protein [Lactococcus lactis]|jgi:DNA repair exonuclease SbcCD ATPase subunit|uniref:Uncharacterized protein n=1 Tax=Lactococcus lactis subsp. lactis A12 TaxID=1137134 RepID=S6EX62_LACLL|nr:hypothetical protein [Lactococcus lactis]CDG05795.1 Putative uncharacterized protein [Lactococcus lactis subsp. lactis A12]SBW29286.1 Putative uncharacterized protein [Lactococcus lactis subsp. lactis]